MGVALTKSEEIVIRDYLHSPMLSRNQGLVDTFVDAIFQGQVPEPHKFLANLHIESVYSHFEKIWNVRFLDGQLSDKQKFTAMIEMEKEALKIACKELLLNFNDVISLIREDAVEFSKSTRSEFSTLRGRAFFDAVEKKYGIAFTDSSWFWRSEIFESWNKAGL